MKGGAPVVFHYVTLPELGQEVLVVRDNDELEVGVVLAFVDNTA